VLLVALCGLLALMPGRASAQGLKLELIAGGLVSPVDVQSPRGDPRLFVVEQTTGRIRIVNGGTLLPTPFLDLGSQISQGGERGLLGLCFDPDYHKNRYFYVCLTNVQGDTEIRRYRCTSWDPNSAESWSGTLVLSVPQPFANHNGGALRFGPDGHLYIGLGDGGGADDPFCNGQSLGSLLGKVLRIDVRSIDISGSYSIPPQNPFVGTAGARGEIYALGLRNPYRFAFDAVTSGLLIADVGEAAREELSYLHLGQPGVNFGWPLMEGTLCNGNTSCPTWSPTCWSPQLRNPIHEYTHDFWTGGCAIIGGATYRGCALPGLQGTSFFADYCSAKIWSLKTDGWSTWELVERTNELAPQGGALSIIACIAEDSQGELIVVEHTGTLWRLLPNGPAPVACPSLRARFQRVSVSQGGLQQIDLSFGSSSAGLAFVLLGSTSGTTPGFSLDGIQVPLNPDAYSQWLLSIGNSGPVAPMAGLLDGQGAALIDLRLPPGTASSSVGLTLQHAALALDPWLLTVRQASNPVPLLLAP
jgi:hypothetical protein